MPVVLASVEAAAAAGSGNGRSDDEDEDSDESADGGGGDDTSENAVTRRYSFGVVLGSPFGPLSALPTAPPMTKSEPSAS